MREGDGEGESEIDIPVAREMKIDRGRRAFAGGAAAARDFSQSVEEVEISRRKNRFYSPPPNRWTVGFGNPSLE